MTKVTEYKLAKIKSSARDIEELNKLQELENLLMEEVVNKFSTIWIICAKIDKLYQEIIGKKYGNNKN